MTTRGPVPAADSEQAKATLPVGVSVLITNTQGQVLMAKRKNNSGAGLISTPGGRLEQNENILQCAEREVMEETGLKLQPPFAVFAWREHFRFGKHYIMFYVHASSYTGEIRNLIPDKSEDWQWFNLADLNEQNCTEPLTVLANLIEELPYGIAASL